MPESIATASTHELDLRFECVSVGVLWVHTLNIALSEREGHPSHTHTTSRSPTLWLVAANWCAVVLMAYNSQFLVKVSIG